MRASDGSCCLRVSRSFMRRTVSVGMLLTISGIRPAGINLLAALFMVLRKNFSLAWMLLVVWAFKKICSLKSLKPC